MSIMVKNPDALLQFQGRIFESSLHLQVSQELVNAYIAVSGDTQWIHWDTARARSNLPNGKTIVPGGLIVALLPRFIQATFKVEDFDKSVVAGFQRVRFRQPLPTGSIISVRAHILSAKRTPQFVRMEIKCKVFEPDINEVIAEAIITDLYYYTGSR